MSLAKTTNSAAITTADTSITVASATGFAPGYLVRVGDEMMRVAGAYNGTATIIPVIRAQEGTLVTAHAVTSTVVCGTAADWSTLTGPQTAVQYPMAGKARRVTTYGAAGAISHPTAGCDEVAIINGTVLAMTLTSPAKDLDGSILWIIGDTKAAHTVTYTTVGFGGGSTGYTVATFDTNAQCGLMLMAVNSIWVLCNSPFSGTLTGIDIAIS